MSSVSYGQIKIKEKVEIKPSSAMINNTNLNKSLNTYLLEYELIWNGAPCASGGIQFRYSWLVSQQSTCTGSYRVGADITEQGIYYFIWSFQTSPDNDETHGTGTANIYLDGLLYESIAISSGTGGNTSTFVSFPTCEEQIVECDDYEPPKIDTSNFEILGANEDWHWIDNDGNPQTAKTGDLCTEIEHPYGDEFGGVTSVRSSIGDTSSTYDVFEDMEITACTDNSNPSEEVWQFSLDNLRIPILLTLCPATYLDKDFIDLEDGKNETLLNQYIKDCAGLSSVISWIDEYWIYGPYQVKAKNIVRYIGEPKFFFTHGILAHENVHKEQLKENIIEKMNGEIGLLNLDTEDFKISTDEFECPEDAIDEITIKIDLLLSDSFEVGKKIAKNEEGWLKIELEADKKASETYEQIRKDIMRWAKEQSWWDADNVFCKEIKE